ncbi:MAG: di-heme oxidoredictase family protein [Pyrinomonadaceae bacterium]
MTSIILISSAYLAALIASRAQEAGAAARRLGREVAIPHHLKDDEEFHVSLAALIGYGKKLFDANWTEQDGGGRPLTKGNGKSLSDPMSPLVGKRSFNRISGPDANSCTGCHNAPFGISGGGGDFVGNVFVLGQRFDFVTFDPKDAIPTKGAVDERSQVVSLNNIANLRATTGMFGAGYIEMLAREITEDLQKIRDSMHRGDSRILVSKGINFGRLTRRADGIWDVSQVTGLPRASVLTATPQDPPSLIIRPWHQAGNVVSLREFTNNALNQHHGIQTTERFGIDTDPDGDGVVNEMTRADVTALTVYQAVLQAPGQVIPNDPAIESAIVNGEKVFTQIGCAICHIPALPLSKRNWTYTEPNPYNPATNLRAGETRAVSIDLNDPALPQPRLKPSGPAAEWLLVPIFTDFKLHDISDPTDDYGIEPLDMNQNVWSPKFIAGNRKFLTKRLWGCANEPPFYHHGLFTTLRQSVLAHSGEALDARRAFQGLAEYDQDSLIEFLKSLQVLPPGTKELVVDENYQQKKGFVGLR